VGGDALSSPALTQFLRRRRGECFIACCRSFRNRVATGVIRRVSQLSFLPSDLLATVHLIAIFRYGDSRYPGNTVNRAVTVTVARLSSVCSTRSETERVLSTLLAKLAEFQPRSQCIKVIAPALWNRFRLVHGDLVEIPGDGEPTGQSSSVSEDRGRRPERAPARIAQPVPARQASADESPEIPGNSKRNTSEARTSAVCFFV